MSVISKAEFAKTAGVSAPAISDLLRKGRLVAMENGRMDTNEPVNAEYLSRRRQVASGAASNPAAYSRGGGQYEGGSPSVQTPGGGTKTALEWDLELKKQKYVELSQKNGLRAGTLLEKQQVLEGFYYPVDQLFQRLLTDCVRSSIGLIHPQIKAGGTEAQAEDILRRQMQNFIKACKVKIDLFYKEIEG